MQSRGLHVCRASVSLSSNTGSTAKAIIFGVDLCPIPRNAHTAAAESVSSLGAQSLNRGEKWGSRRDHVQNETLQLIRRLHPDRGGAEDYVIRSMTCIHRSLVVVVVFLVTGKVLILKRKVKSRVNRSSTCTLQMVVKTN